jgi:hypothetical protein
LLHLPAFRKSPSNIAPLLSLLYSCEREQRRATDELNQKGEAYVILILEILLTAAAWRRGWNALALVPLAIVIVVGIALGAMMGVSHPGQSTSELTQQLAPIALCGDLLALAALGTMAARGRQTHF